MQRWTETKIKWYLEMLERNDTANLASALFRISKISSKSEPMPTGSHEVVSYLEHLVKDHRICVVDGRIPYTYGEMRWLAARVLACEYAYLGIETPIILKDVLQPILDVEIGRLVKQYKTMTVSKLYQQGLIPRVTEIIKPQDYTECCSKEAVEKRNQFRDVNE